MNPCKHDFRRDGSRTAAKVVLAGWTLWLEESAAARLSDAYHYGIDVHRAPGLHAGRIDLGRFSLNVARSRPGPMSGRSDRGTR